MTQSPLKLVEKLDPQDEIDELKALLGQDVHHKNVLGMSMLISRLLMLLLKKTIVTPEMAITALYHDRIPADRPQAKTIDVFMVRLRKWCRDQGVEIHNSHGTGWFLKPEEKAKIQALIDADDMTSRPAVSMHRTGKLLPNEPVIEKGIPIPHWRPWVKLFPKMQVGDSFFVKGKTPGSLAVSISKFRKDNHEKRFIIRKQNGGYRVWRTT